MPHKTRFLVTAITLVLVVVGLRADCAISRYSVWLKANPQAIVADGRSQTTITAEVRDASGRSAPDGTRVDFTSSLGTIDRDARTVAGTARVRLQSPASVGTAIISAVVTTGNAVATIRVDLLEPGTELFDESFISIESKKHLGMDVETRLIDSAGGVTVYHRGLTITAEEAQIDMRRTVLRAKAGSENIVIKRGDKKIEASALFFDFNSMSGVILTPASDGAKRVLLRGRDMFTEADEKPDPSATFDFEPISEASMFVKARSILIRPGEEIKFKRAAFYVEGDRILSMPLHVEPLRGDKTSLNRMLTYGTEGLRLDVPFYYSLTPNGSGAVRLRHSQAGGWGYNSGRSGWQVDLEQEYYTGSSTEGTFLLNRVTSKDEWGARWSQRKEFNDDSTLYSYVDFPAHRNLYSSVDYTRLLGDDFTMSLNFRGDKAKNVDARYATSAYIQSKPKPLLSGLASYSLTSRLSYDNYRLGASNGTSGGLGLQLYGKPVQFGANASVNTSLSVNRDYGGLYSGTMVNGNVGYSTGLGSFGQLGLNYSYSSSHSAYAFSQQRIAADLSISPNEKWRAYLYGTYGIGERSTSAFAELSYMFMPTWRVHLLGTLQQFEGFRYTDAEVALAKAIGQQEVRVVWSQSLKRFRVEFSALSF